MQDVKAELDLPNGGHASIHKESRVASVYFDAYTGEEGHDKHVYDVNKQVYVNNGKSVQDGIISLPLPPKQYTLTSIMSP